MEKLEIDEPRSRSVADYIYDHPFEVPEWYLVHVNILHGEKGHRNEAT